MLPTELDSDKTIPFSRFSSLIVFKKLFGEFSFHVKILPTLYMKCLSCPQIPPSTGISLPKPMPKAVPTSRPTKCAGPRWTKSQKVLCVAMSVASCPMTASLCPRTFSTITLGTPDSNGSGALTNVPSCLRSTSTISLASRGKKCWANS